MRRPWQGSWRRVRDRFTGVHPLAFDAVLTVLLTALSLAEFDRPVPAGSAAHPPDLAGSALVIALCAPLVLRRRFPRAAFAVMLLVGAVLAGTGYRQSVLGPTLSVGIYTLGSRCDLRRSLPLLAGCVGLLVVAGFGDPDQVTTAEVVQSAAAFGAFWWVGSGLRVRAAYARAVEERADLLRQVHEDRARHAVVEERLRIARELHDVVAHTLSVVAVQSGMARHVLDDRPDQARAALDEISTASRSTLTELRRLLGVLRDDDRPAGALTPTPGLAELEGLVDQVRRAGRQVTLTVTGERRDLPPGLDLTAYRIIQEALTNTVKHAGRGASVTVRLDYRPERLTVGIEDRDGGPAPATDGAGVGLVGMRERVAAFGGRLTTGRTADGYAVRAELPLATVIS